MSMNQDRMARQISEILKDYEARGGMHMLVFCELMNDCV